MTIYPLIPHIPTFLSYLIYGLGMGAVFRFARRGGNGCIVAVILWYILFLASVFFFGLLSVTSSENQVSFALGFIFPFTRTLWESEMVQVPFSILQNLIRFSRHLFWKVQNGWQAIRETRAPERNEQEPINQNRESRSANDEAMRQEQERRAEEARSRREQAERARGDAESQEEERRRASEGQENKKTEPPKSPSKDRDSRSPAEILGLKAPWTEDDLKTAYRREAGRTHPDKWIGKPEVIRQAMEEEYKAIQEAYRKLKG